MRHFLREWRTELLLFLVGALGVFLILEQLDIRGSILRWLNRAVDTIAGAGGDLLSGIIPTTASDVLGMILIVGVILMTGWRLRWRLQRTPSLTDRHCPRCGDSISRIKRRPQDRWIDSLIVPVHRYMCGNSECRWTGLRVKGVNISLEATDVPMESLPIMGEQNAWGRGE